MKRIRIPFTLLIRSFSSKPTLLQQLSSVQLQSSLSSGQFVELCKRAKSENEVSSAILLKLKKILVSKLKWSTLTYSQFLSVLSTHMSLASHQSILDRELIIFFKSQINQLNPDTLIQTRLFVAQNLSMNKSLSTALKQAVLRNLKFLSGYHLINLLWEVKFQKQISDLEYVHSVVTLISNQVTQFLDIEQLLKLTTAILELKRRKLHKKKQELEPPLRQLQALLLSSFSKLISQMTLEEIASLLLGFFELELELTPDILSQLQHILIDSRRIVLENNLQVESIDRDILKIYRALLIFENITYDMPKFRRVILAQIYKNNRAKIHYQIPETEVYSSQSILEMLLINDQQFKLNPEIIKTFPLESVNREFLRKTLHNKLDILFKKKGQFVLFSELQKMKEVRILSSSLFQSIKEAINEELFLRIPDLSAEYIATNLLTPDNCELYFSFDVIMSLNERIKKESENISEELRSRVLFLIVRSKDEELFQKFEDEKREEWKEIKNLLQI